jgi:hypothetical protein
MGWFPEAFSTPRDIISNDALKALFLSPVYG